MQRALQSPVIVLLIFEELDSASSLLACAKVCRRWHDQAMFVRVKNHPVSLFNLIQTIAPILPNATDAEGGFFASIDVPTDRHSITSLDPGIMTSIGANVRSISLDLALDPSSVMLIRGAIRRHVGPILPQLNSLVVPPEIERWDLRSILTTLDFLFSVSSPVTTVTFADACDTGYVRGMMESFAMNQVPISRLYRGRLSEADEWPDSAGYDFLWDVTQVELLQPPSPEEWCQLSDCASLKELTVRDPLPRFGYFYRFSVNFSHLRTLQIPWTMATLLRNTRIPNLRKLTITSLSDASHEPQGRINETILSTLVEHSPQLQEVSLHDIFVQGLEVLQPILYLKDIKVIELLNVDWDGVLDSDIERIALMLPHLNTFIFRDRGHHRRERMLTATSLLVVATHCKNLVRLELPLSLKDEQRVELTATHEEQMHFLRYFGVKVYYEDAKVLPVFLQSLQGLCPSVVDFVIKTTEEEYDAHWTEYFYVTAAKYRKGDRNGKRQIEQGCIGRVEG
ncbi:hypothetical protein FS837_010983 [Tulasnella sp. UAMH 9824]|nr:hypothetical protein FS837_010983 [Tulasnella sp. UAMH 9824]